MQTPIQNNACNVIVPQFAPTNSLVSFFYKELKKYNHHITNRAKGISNKSFPILLANISVVYIANPRIRRYIHLLAFLPNVTTK